MDTDECIQQIQVIVMCEMWIICDAPVICVKCVSVFAIAIDIITFVVVPAKKCALPIPTTHIGGSEKNNWKKKKYTFLEIKFITQILVLNYNNKKKDLVFQYN